MKRITKTTILISVIIVAFSTNPSFAQETPEVKAERITELDALIRNHAVEFKDEIYVIGEYARSYSYPTEYLSVYKSNDLDSWELVQDIDIYSRHVKQVFADDQAIYILISPQISPTELEDSKYMLWRSEDGETFENVMNTNISLWNVTNQELDILTMFNNKLLFINNRSMEQRPRMHSSNNGTTWKKRTLRGWAFEKDYQGGFQIRRLRFIALAENSENLYAIVRQEGRERHALIRSDNGLRWIHINSNKDNLWFKKRALGKTHLLNTAENLLMITPSKKNSGLKIYQIVNDELEIINTNPEIQYFSKIYQKDNGEFIAIGQQTPRYKYGFFLYSSVNGIDWEKEYAISGEEIPDLEYNDELLAAQNTHVEKYTLP